MIVTSPEILAAAFGALIVWCFQLFDKMRDRGRQRESTLVAIASEVRTICALIRYQKYLDAFHEQALLIRQGNWSGEFYIIDIRGEYFKVYDANAENLCALSPDHVSKIVGFYAFCQSAIDSTRPDGPHADSGNTEDKANNMLGVEGLLRAILALGDEIVQFPKMPLPVMNLWPQSRLPSQQSWRIIPP